MPRLRPGNSRVAFFAPPFVSRDVNESLRGPLRTIVSVAVDPFGDRSGATRTWTVAGPSTVALDVKGGGVEASRSMTRTPSGGGGVRSLACAGEVAVAEGVAL